MGVMPPGAVPCRRVPSIPCRPWARVGRYPSPGARVTGAINIAEPEVIFGCRGRVRPTIFGQFSPGAAGPRPVPGGRCRVGVSPHGMNAACPVLVSRHGV